MMSLLINDDVILGRVANLEVTDVGNHVGKERVAGYVERLTQTLRRGRIKELSDYLVANKLFENISSFYCIYSSVPSLVTLLYLGYISDPSDWRRFVKASDWRRFLKRLKSNTHCL